MRIAAPDISEVVDSEYARGRYWPEPLIQINPNYKQGSTVLELAQAGVLHRLTAEIFQVGKDAGQAVPVRFYKHQQDSLALAQALRSFVVTTGTGSGKSLAFFIPIVDRVLRAREVDATPRTRAIIIYPMNALANSQAEEIGKFMQNVGPLGSGLSIARYTGQESTSERQALAANPPDILLTNFMMLELILILTPPTLLPEAPMATIQAALKRGIEQTFQIESAELVVEALPSPHDRKSLLLYEAAEGGAGVLSRLASDPAHLAQVARVALSMMHYQVPENEVHADHLTDLAGENAGPEALPCEAGCYQCLLSYFNQPDHEIIDRRNTAAVGFLVSLANATVQSLHPADVVARTADGDASGSLQNWLAAVTKHGLRQPDQVNLPINGGEATADAVYQTDRALVFLTPPSQAVSAYAQDRGFTAVVVPADPSEWMAVFASHVAIFGSLSHPS